MTDTKFYVYGLINPITKLPFYVGKGCGNRYMRHLTEKSSSFKCDTIKGIRNKGYEPEIYFYAKNLTNDEAYNFEKTVIKLYGRIRLDSDGILTNRCEDNRPPRLTKQYIKNSLGIDKFERTPEWNKNNALARPNRKAIITPLGKFDSCCDFSRKTMLVGPDGLRNMLKCADVPLSYSRQGQLKSIFTREDIGKTPRELGWYFDEVI